jgi:IMP dehydrogenase/GMP reductase
LTKQGSRPLALMLVLPVVVVPVRTTATAHGIPLVSAAMVDFQLWPTLELAEAVPLAVEDGLTGVVVQAMIAKLAAMAEAGVSTFGTKDRLVFCSLFHSF